MMFLMFGRYPFINELPEEREHRFLKGLTRSTKSPMESLKNNLHTSAVALQLQCDKGYITLPHYTIYK